MAALCSSFFVAPPPELYHPVVTAKFGRYVYLTILTNILNTLYFGVYIWSCLFGGATAKAIVIKLFSLSFGLGFFLTLGYYSLDHFNPANAPRMNALMGEYPYIWEAAHVAHGHGLPAVVFHAVVDSLLIHKQASSSSSSSGDFYSVTHAFRQTTDNKADGGQ